MSTETNSEASIHLKTAAEIAETLEVTPRTVRYWAEAGDLPTLARGRFDIGWAQALQIGRIISRSWSRKPPACVAVAAGWVSYHEGAPTDRDLEMLGDLFTRNGKKVSDAMQSVGVARARMGRV